MTFPLRDSTFRPGSGLPPRGRRDEPQTLRILNWPLLAGTLIALLLIVPSGYFWHEYQLRKQVHTFLELATRAEESGNFWAAEVCLKRYLQIRPNDVDAATRLTNDIQRGSNRPQDWIRAVPVLSAILDLHPDRDDLRVKMAELQAISNPESGMRTIDAVLVRQKDKPDPAALRLRARIMDRLAGAQPLPRELANVTAAYAKALESDPSNLEVAFRLALLYRQNADSLSASESVNRKSLEDRADALMDEAVSKNPSRAEAYVGRFRYRNKYPKDKSRAGDDRLDADLREALKLAPNSGEARLLAAADVLRLALKESYQDPSENPINDPTVPHRQIDKSRLAEAAAHAANAIAAEPKDSRGFLLLAQIQLLRDQPDKAIQTMQEGIRQADPDHPILNTRLAGALIEAGQWKAANETLARLDLISQKVRSQLQRPSEADRLQAVTGILRAQYFSGPNNPERNLVRAAGALEEATKLSLGTKLSATANYQLGSVYSSLNQWDLAIAAFKRAGNSNPDSVLPVLGSANAMLHAGQFAGAIDEFHRAQRMVAKVGGPEDPLLLIDLARAELGKQMRLPPDKQDWSGFKETLAQIRKVAPKNIMPMALEIQEALERDPDKGKEKAKSLLEAAQPTFKDSTEYWRTAFETYLLLHDDKQAQASLDQLEKLSKEKSPELRAKLLTALGKIDEAQKILTQAGVGRTGAAYQQTVAEQARLSRIQGDVKSAAKKYEELAKATPKDARWPWELAQIAVMARDGAALDRWEERLRDIEGPEGFYWRYAQTQRLLLEAKLGQKGSVAQAGESARELVKRRPQWPLARFAEGLTAEAQGGYYEAYNAYHRSFELGDRERPLLRRMIGMQILLNHEDRAWAELEGLSADLQTSPELAPLAVHLAIQQQKPVRAIALARAAVARSPQSPDYYLLLARALAANPDPKTRAEVEKTLQQAVSIGPGDVSTWLAILHFYLTPGGPDAANEGLTALRRVSEMLQSSGSLPPSRQSLIVAKAYEMMGDLRSADRYYRKANLDDPKDPLLRSLPSSVYISGDLTESNASLWTNQIRTAAAPVRRLLGVLLAASPSSSDQSLGMDLLQSEPTLRAVALLSCGTVDGRNQAVALLEKIPESSQTRGDRVRLGKIYQQLGKAAPAKTAFGDAAKRSPTRLQWLAILDFYLQQKLWDDALKGAAAAQAAHGADAELLERQVRALTGQGKPRDATTAAKEYVERKDDDGSADPKSIAKKQRATAAANVLAEAGLIDEGVKILESAVGAGQPAVIQLMAGSPSTAGRALELCAERIKKDNATVESAVLAAQSLARAGVTKPDERFEPVFARLTAQSPPTSLTSNLAVLREHQGRFTDAIAVTEQSLTREPRDIISLNNLAWFLAAYTNRQQQALEKIDLVIQRLGPLDSVLDTKGVVLLGQKRTEQAIRLLEIATDAPSSSGTNWLHLAAAYQAANRAQDSRQCLQEAKRRGLNNISPFDRKTFESLSK